MKKTLLFLSISLFALSSFGQWQDFENWTNNSVQTLDGYQTPVNERGIDGSFATFPSTDAFIGSTSVRLESVISSFGDTIFGFFIDGDFDTQSPGQAVTLNGVDSLIGYYKYDIMPGDSALLIAVTTFSGTPTGGGLWYINGQQTTWKRFAYPITAIVADSLLFGSATGDPANNFNGIPGSWIQYDNVHLKRGAQTQNLMNFSFENWTPINWEDPTGWTTGNLWAIGEPTLPCNKTADSYAGSFAIELSNIQNGNGDTLWGAATNGYFGNNGAIGGEPFSGTPTGVECYYKYAPSGNDTAYISFEFMQNGSLVGQYGGALTTQANYTLWSQNVSAMTPDTLLVSLWSGSNTGSILKVDDIDIVFSVGIAEGLTVEKIVSYPNPATDELNIRFNIENNNSVMINLIDITGKTLETRNMGNLSAGTYRETFNTSNYSSGIYFIEFALDNEKVTKRFAIK